MATKVTRVLSEYAAPPQPLSLRSIIIHILQGRADHCRERVRHFRFLAADLDLAWAEGARVGGRIREAEAAIAYWQDQLRMAKEGISRRTRR